MTATTIKEHAAAVARAVAHGGIAREEYSRIVRENDLTMGELSALRIEIDRAITALLQTQAAALQSIFDWTTDVPERTPCDRGIALIRNAAISGGVA